MKTKKINKKSDEQGNKVLERLVRGRYTQKVRARQKTSSAWYVPKNEERENMDGNVLKYN